MFRIRRTQVLAPDIKLLEIEAPLIARKRKAGQFVIVRVHEHGERIPLTIADADSIAGTITLIVQGVGKTTRLINLLETDDALRDVVGPLGKPSEIPRSETVVVIGGGVGTAIAYPTAVAMKDAGNQVLAIIGARTRKLIILESEMRAACDNLFVITDDGSYGEHGFVTDRLKQLIESRRRIDHVLAIGPIPMMEAVAETTRPHRIRTVVSLNPIMVDGTGMCGGCRVFVGGECRFACVDGPEFDAHAVDFQILMQRNRLYQREEQVAMAHFSPESELAEVRACRLQSVHPEVGPRAPAVLSEHFHG
jgi:ferredoxin--NADP+ reductase